MLWKRVTLPGIMQNCFLLPLHKSASFSEVCAVQCFELHHWLTVLVLFPLIEILTLVLPLAVVVVPDGQLKSIESQNQMQSLFCRSVFWAGCLCELLELLLLSRRAAELSLWYALGITWAFIFIYLYCMGWILNSSFSSQCRACCKSITIVQRLVYPPGCALFPRRCGVLCTSTEMHWLLPSGAFCWKPVNLAFQTWNWNCRGNIFYTS